MARTEEQAEMLRGRLRKNARRLGRWARRAEITCYRVYDRDIPEVPLALDLYEGRLHIAVFEDRRRSEEPAAAWLEAMAAAAAEQIGIPEALVFTKTHRRQAGRSQYGRFSSEGAIFEVSEGGHRFRVNLSDYLDTGLFLDHRATRSLVAAEAKDKRFLNLFAYTGSFTVYAAAAGARETTTVDLSRPYLDWARENLALNGFATEAEDPGSPHRLIRDDVLAWLDARLRPHDTDLERPGPGKARSPRRARRYDLIVVDPPTWSTSKKMEGTLDLQRDHVALLHKVLALLDPGGVLWFSTNNRRFRLDPAAFEATTPSGTCWEETTARTHPADFRDPKIHRSWRLELPGGPGRR